MHTKEALKSRYLRVTHVPQLPLCRVQLRILTLHIQRVTSTYSGDEAVERVSL